MKGEIDRDFYCSGILIAYNGKVNYCVIRGREVNFELCKNCTSCHRKWPTPEQFKAEYGFEWPDDGAVYSRAQRTDNTCSDWQVSAFGFAKCTLYEIQVVCACAPWGKPPDDWRPE